MVKGKVLSTVLIASALCGNAAVCQGVISEVEFTRMSNGEFKNVQEVLTLFPKSVADVKKRVELSIQQVTSDLNSIKNIDKSDRTFDNTARALDLIKRRLEIVKNSFEVVCFVSSEQDVRDAARQGLAKIETEEGNLLLDQGIYKAFSEYAEKSESEEGLLSEEEKCFIKKMNDDFVRGGVNLDDETRQEVAELNEKISEKCQEFNCNVQNNKRSIKVSLEELNGVGEDFVKSLDRDGDLYKVNCNYPSNNAIMRHCSVGETRKKFYLEFLNRGYPQNEDVLKKIISLLHELALKLGYKSHADFAISNQMAGSRESAELFIKSLMKKAKANLASEYKPLLDNLPDNVTLREGKFEPWDIAYTEEKYETEHHNLNDNKIAQYFEAKKTLKGILDHYAKFLNVKFTLLENVKGLWAKDVFVVEVRRGKAKKPEGYIFLDLFTRDGKHTHTCFCDTVYPVACCDGDAVLPSVGVIVTNFSKPTQNGISLLKHGEVNSLCHELGHAMHHFLGRTTLSSLSGTHVTTDFVEVPSQFFEGFIWDKEGLQSIGCHHETEVPLTDELVKAMIQRRYSGFSRFLLGQGCRSLFALTCFDGSGEKNLNALSKEIYDYPESCVHFDPDTHHYAAFGHLANPLYGPRYYAYQWTKILALICFDHIEKNGGLQNSEMGKKFVDTVLSKGGSLDPNELIENFLGYEPDIGEFLEGMLERIRTGQI